jgi:hypothetical protein
MLTSQQQDLLYCMLTNLTTRSMLSCIFQAKYLMLFRTLTLTMSNYDGLFDFLQTKHPTKSLSIYLGS